MTAAVSGRGLGIEALAQALRGARRVTRGRMEGMGGAGYGGGGRGCGDGDRDRSLGAAHACCHTAHVVCKVRCAAARAATGKAPSTEKGRGRGLVSPV